MSSKLIEADILKLETALSPIDSQLDAKLQEFVTALAPAVADWMAEEVKRQVERNAEKVNSAGVEMLRNLKSDLSALITRLPEVCASAIGKPDEWPHRRMAASSSLKQRNSGESYFAATFRKAISPLGAVLHKYDLLHESAGFANSWERASGDSFRFAINPGFDERKFESIAQYKQLRANYKRQSEELETKRQMLSKAKARELWDEA